MRFPSIHHQGSPVLLPNMKIPHVTKQLFVFIIWTWLLPRLSQHKRVLHKPHTVKTIWTLAETDSGFLQHAHGYFLLTHRICTGTFEVNVVKEQLPSRKHGVQTTL